VLRRNGIDGGKVKGNLAGDWAPGREEPVGVFSNLEPEKALEIYRSRMKMEPSFRDLKGLLGLENGMSKKLENPKKWIAFMLLAYAVGLRIGETIRDEVYRGKKAPGLLGAFYPPPAPAPAEAHPAGPGPVQGHRPRPCPISCLKVSTVPFTSPKPWPVNTPTPNESGVGSGSSLPLASRWTPAPASPNLSLPTPFATPLPPNWL